MYSRDSTRRTPPRRRERPPTARARGGPPLPIARVTTASSRPRGESAEARADAERPAAAQAVAGRTVRHLGDPPRGRDPALPDDPALRTTHDAGPRPGVPGGGLVPLHHAPPPVCGNGGFGPAIAGGMQSCLASETGMASRLAMRACRVNRYWVARAFRPRRAAAGPRRRWSGQGPTCDVPARPHVVPPAGRRGCRRLVALRPRPPDRVPVGWRLCCSRVSRRCPSGSGGAVAGPVSSGRAAFARPAAAAPSPCHRAPVRRGPQCAGR